MHDQDQDFDKQDNLDDQNRDEQTSDTSPHPPTGQSWASISQSLRKYNTWLDTALSLPQDGNGREPRRLFHNLAREHYTPIQSLRARYNSLRTPQPHPMSLVATLDVIHMPGLNTLQASEVISNYNIQRKHSNLTAIMKDSGSNVHLIPDNQVENIGIPALSILKPSKLSGIGTQQTLGTTDILFGIRMKHCLFRRQVLNWEYLLSIPSLFVRLLVTVANDIPKVYRAREVILGFFVGGFAYCP